MKTDGTMLRLRAANPFSDTDDAAHEELFAHITAHPRDLRERRRRHRRPLVVVALAFITVAVLASTAFAISQWIGNDVVKPDVTKAEYLDAQRVLVVPPGFEWPRLHVEPNSVTSRSGGGTYAVLLAENAWDCYWVAAIRRGDSAGQARAEAEANNLLRNHMLVAPVGAPEGWVPADPPKRPVAVFAHDGGYEWLKETYTLAAAGHPERLAQRCRANAPN